MPTPPTGTVTLLFTDIEGSTRLLQRLGERYPAVLAAHQQLLRAAFQSRDGYEVRTEGDSFFAAFARAGDAVAAAVAAQRALAAHPWPTDAVVRVRMGLHTGEPAATGDDYVGLDVHRAARLGAAGHGGQVLLSRTTRDLVEHDLPEGVGLRDLGVHRLKDLLRPEQIVQLVIADLPDTFPPLKTLAARPSNLPIQATALIGREREIAAVDALLRRDDVRLVTLSGPGGTGKTRLALQTAAELLDTFADGVSFVALAPISDPDLVVSAIAQTLGVTESSGQPLVAQLKAYLQTKQLLLVLDNFEQVLAAAPLVGELLAAAPALKVLVTSRATLHLYGEHEYAVAPLALPEIPLPPLEQLTQYDAVRLFIERAQAVKADFTVTKANAPAVAEICARLDGLPLAIELAAARSKLFAPQALLARLDKRLTLLTGGAQNLPARQQTIRSTIDWSYQLLDAGAKKLFTRLGVFVGGCTLEAIEAVCNADSDLPLDVVDGVAALVDQSLVRQEDSMDSESRFLMFETIREYALEQLEQSGEAAALRRQHAAYYLALVEATEPKLRSAARDRELARFDIDHDNLRAALQWSATEPDYEVWLRLAGTLWMFWYFQAYWGEGYRWQSGAVSSPEAARYPAALAKALYACAAVAFMRSAETGDYTIALASAEESARLWRELGDRHELAVALFWVSFSSIEQGYYNEAKVACEESLQLFREARDDWWLAVALNCRGVVEIAQGEPKAARGWLEQSVAMWQVLEDKWGLALPLGNLGRATYKMGEYEAARRYYEQALILRREIGDKTLVGPALNGLGHVAQQQGNHVRAKALFQESLILNHEAGRTVISLESLVGLAGLVNASQAVRWLGAVACTLDALGVREAIWDGYEAIPYKRNLEIARSKLDTSTFAAAWAKGRAMTLEQAIAEALAFTAEAEQPLPSPPPSAVAPAPSPSLPAGLTAREVEILRLVAQGLTDALVAERLVVSPRTVSGHLRAIYSKLQVTSRTAATRFAIEHGLL